ncbi:tetratricopeptide repeat protein [Alteromonas sp. 1_MG-2023]|uniref:tetratricopeptide repeat protein n=1 Tax=Alteromonas sp. 1_MG-2023 TaxID=3062669 RepID=UPI0026E3009D|nr:tetratricopeptide repeat protein [Alteromonas sp. 1_MG-2023]MDO6565567.1 tetratricopeptide repeat protein [Alteromonas sp. 1_MG-2023]
MKGDQALVFKRAVTKRAVLKSPVLKLASLKAMRLPRKAWLSILLLSLCGCSFSFQEQEKAVNSDSESSLLSQLNIAPIEVEKTKLEPVGLSEIRDGYAQVVGKLDNEQLARQLDLRLADVEMLLAEEKQTQIPLSPDQSIYQDAITAYQNVLINYPNDETKEAVLYQLSRAYDLDAQPEKSVAVLQELLAQFPSSEHAAEAWFRMGEASYSEGNYRAASQVYDKVIQIGGHNAFYTMSAYMQGWAYYNLEDYDAALVSFDNMLSASFSDIADEQLPTLDALSRGQQRLVKDSLRLMSVLFSLKGNGKAVVAFFSNKQNANSHDASRPTAAYQHLVFNELAQQHLDNDRYIDASEAYLAFANAYPAHSEAVEFYVRHIDAFILGDFPSEVLAAKAGFIEMFGKGRGLFESLTVSSQDSAKPYLHTYLRELAQAQHSFAQQLSSPERRHTLPETIQRLDDQSLKAQTQAAYAKAAGYYTDFIDTFPEDALRPQIEFNLAESYFESKQFAKAIFHYERFAYTFTQHEKASDGAYAALLAYDNLIDQHNSTDSAFQASWLEKQRSSRVQFIRVFDYDARAITVVQTLMQSHFDLARLGAMKQGASKQGAAELSTSNTTEFESALKYSRWLLSPPKSQTTPVSDAIQTSAQLVEAHALFGLARFALAESAYAKILSDLPPQDNNVKSITRNYAVSMYKQADTAVAKGDYALALTHLQRIIANTPNTDVRINAQYDAATYLIAEARLEEAQLLLEDFARRFPNHELAKTIEDNRLYVYEESEKWQEAAEILYAKWSRDKQSETGRTALYQAAEYYEKAGNRAKSLPAYRAYAHAYPAPFTLAMEARFTMSLFYLESGEEGKRRFWLNKLIKAHDASVSESARNTDENTEEETRVRSKTLAAMAAMVFADDAKYVFDNIKLTQPLKQSLSKKRTALTKAVNAHNKVLSYGVREYVTVASHQLGTLYRTLAQDLMASERPSQLNALELEQYDLLLEEQAYPFEEQAIQVYEINAQRSWDGLYDKWVKASFTELSELLPSRYRKVEKLEEVSVEHY